MALRRTRSFRATAVRASFGGLAGGAQPLIEGAENRDSSGRRRGGHVEHGAHRRAAAPAGAAPAEGATVARQRRDADERGDLAAIEVAEFGQQAEQRRGQRRAHAGHTLQQFILDPPERTGFDQLAQLAVGVGEAPLEPVDVAAEIGADPAVTAGMPLPLGQQHVEQLAAAQQDRLELLGGGIRQGPGGGRTRAPKSARTCASIASVLAKRPRALAKSRTWRGFTTATGRPAAASAATTGAS